MNRFDFSPPLHPAERPLAAALDAPAPTLRRGPREHAQPLPEPTNPLLSKAFPNWVRLPANPVRGTEGAVFAAGASLALLDPIARADPPFAGALRQRLALRAATASAAMARLREDERDLRDAEHLAPFGETTQTSPAGRLHRLWRLFAARPLRLDAPTLRRAAYLLGLPDDASLEGLATAVHDIVTGAEHPLAAAARASAAVFAPLEQAPPAGADVSSPGNRPDAEILALWVADVALAKSLGWEAPLPLLAATIAHPSLRSISSGGASNRAADVSSGAGKSRAESFGGASTSRAAGRRPRPGDAEWFCSCASAYTIAAQEAFSLASDLARRSEKLFVVAPKLRAKGAGRVVDLLLADDAVSPARAARAGGLSDRAARRLFDRLVELGAVRELSGRPNFRLYGL
jgi:hypothetical protein